MTNGLMALVLTAAMLAFSGCCKSDAESSGSSDPAPAVTVNAPGKKRFEGTYESNWGNTTFRQVGTTVTAKYPKGRMTCTASGKSLDCTWFEGSARGKALLTLQPNGNITGTWGKGTSATNGGPWTFTPL